MNLGGTSFITAAQSAFVNKMTRHLSITAPGVDPLVVIQTGATEIRHKFAASQVAGIVAAYMSGLKVAFAIVIGAAGLSLIIGLFNRWKKLNAEVAKEAGGPV